MQEQLSLIVDRASKQEQMIDNVKEAFRQIASANEKMHREYDLLQIWISRHENDEVMQAIAES